MEHLNYHMLVLLRLGICIMMVFRFLEMSRSPWGNECGSWYETTREVFGIEAERVGMREPERRVGYADPRPRTMIPMGGEGS